LCYHAVDANESCSDQPTKTTNECEHNVFPDGEIAFAIYTIKKSNHDD
jgi:hypothetical protein